MNDQKSKWYQEIWFVILMLFGFGPFAFPLLWKSPKFSRNLKRALTVLFTILTVLATWFSIEAIKLIWKQMEELQATLGSF